ncbi:MAG: thioredoxin [Ruminococcus sp.]|nr:thioredoxin [Ruminococcus sp.]
MSVIKLNSENFNQEIMMHTGVALVDFYADWCGPCKMVSPIVDEIAEEYKSIKVGKINVDECPELAVSFGVVSIPTLVVVKDGKEQSRIVGYRPKEDILEELGV